MLVVPTVLGSHTGENRRAGINHLAGQSWCLSEGEIQPGTAMQLTDVQFMHAAAFEMYFPTERVHVNETSGSKRPRNAREKVVRFSSVSDERQKTESRKRLDEFEQAKQEVKAVGFFGLALGTVRHLSDLRDYATAELKMDELTKNGSAAGYQTLQYHFYVAILRRQYEKAQLHWITLYYLKSIHGDSEAAETLLTTELEDEDASDMNSEEQGTQPYNYRLQELKTKSPTKGSNQQQMQQGTSTLEPSLPTSNIIPTQHSKKVQTKSPSQTFESFSESNISANILRDATFFQPTQEAHENTNSERLVASQQKDASACGSQNRIVLASMLTPHLKRKRLLRNLDETLTRSEASASTTSRLSSRVLFDPL